MIFPVVMYGCERLDHKESCESHSVMSDSLRPHELYCPWNSPGQNTEVGSLSLLQGIFPTQGSNPGLPHCRQILYQLSHQPPMPFNVEPIGKSPMYTQPHPPRAYCRHGKLYEDSGEKRCSHQSLTNARARPQLACIPSLHMVSQLCHLTGPSPSSTLPFISVCLVFFPQKPDHF